MCSIHIVACGTFEKDVMLVDVEKNGGCFSHGDIYIVSSRVIFSSVYFVGACVCTLASIIRACAEDVC